MTSVLLLTHQHALDYQTLMLWLQGSEERLAARKVLRPDRQASAKRGADTRRARG